MQFDEQCGPVLVEAADGDLGDAVEVGELLLEVEKVPEITALDGDFDDVGALGGRPSRLKIGLGRRLVLALHAAAHQVV